MHTMFIPHDRMFHHIDKICLEFVAIAKGSKHNKENIYDEHLQIPQWECHARSAKFWMSANTRTLVLAPFHKFLVPYQGFFGFPSI